MKTRKQVTAAKRFATVVERWNTEVLPHENRAVAAANKAAESAHAIMRAAAADRATPYGKRVGRLLLGQTLLMLGVRIIQAATRQFERAVAVN